LISDFILQLPTQQGGWGLPKIDNYVQSIHARIVSVWATEQDETTWLEIEKVISQPFVLDKRVRELPPAVKLAL